MSVSRATVLAKSGEAVKAGPIGLAVILLLCIACYFLFKSMSKHMKEVRENFPTDESPAAPVRPAAASDLQRAELIRTEPARPELASGEPSVIEPSVIEPSVIEPSVFEPSAVESVENEPAENKPAENTPSGTESQPRE